MKELRPRPFCGVKPNTYQRTNRGAQDEVFLVDHPDNGCLLSRMRFDGQAWNARTEAKVSGEAILDIAKSIDLCSEDISNSMDWQETHDLRESLKEISDRLRSLPAPQSPVVPGVPNESVIHDAFIELGWGPETAKIDAKRFRAHLLANARESREDDALKKELAELQRKAFDEFVTLANGYREALETTLKVINEQAQMNGCIKGTLWADDITTLVELIEEALATVGKEG